MVETIEKIASTFVAIGLLLLCLTVPLSILGIIFELSFGKYALYVIGINLISSILLLLIGGLYLILTLIWEK